MAQEYADKEYYLVDSLDLEELSVIDKELLEKVLTEFHKTKSDTSQIYVLTEICDNLFHNSWKKYQKFQVDLIQLALKEDRSLFKSYTFLINYAGSINNMGLIYEYSGDLEQALVQYLKSLELQLVMKNLAGEALARNNLATIYLAIGNIEEGFNQLYKCLKIREKLFNDNPTDESRRSLGFTLSSIGAALSNQGEIEQSLSYCRKAMEVFEVNGDKIGLGRVHDQMGVMLHKTGRYADAESHYEKSASIHKELGAAKELAANFNNMAVLYDEQGNKEKALIFLQKGLDICLKLNDEAGIIRNTNNLGRMQLSLGNLIEAERLNKEGLERSKNMGFPKFIQGSAKALSEVYEKQGKGMKALEMYKLYVEMKDSINNEATQKATIRQQTQYEFEKAQIVKENKAKEEARLLEEETSRRNNLQYSLIFLGILVLFVAILMLGFIRVSPSVAEGLIFFAFLILFEFVLVFTEPYLEQYTNGEPMYNLLANSVLAIMIFPVHAILEKLLKKRIVKN